MGQEPGSESDIKTFCSNQYHVTFPMFSKIDVKGSNQSPLYTYLTEEAQNGVESNKVAWNFQKYIIGKNGKLIKSYSPPTSVFDPEFIKAVELALN
jgi:glutathione peroxidase